MITLFTIPKPFRGHIGTIQQNAIRSWTLLKPKPEVILLGSEEGTDEAAAKYGVRHYADLSSNEFGTPLLSSAFAIAEQRAQFDRLCYVNCDILLLSDFASLMRRRFFQRYLVVGGRWNLDVGESLDFDDPAWEHKLRERVSHYGSRHSHWGIDFFLFPRGLWGELPPFAIGRLMWDNWLIFRARSLGIPVVDASAVVNPVHQNHAYSLRKKLDDGTWNWDDPEINRNLQLAGGPEHSFNLHDATWTLRRTILVPAVSRDILEQRLRRLPADATNSKIRVSLMRSALRAGIYIHDVVGWRPVA